MDYRGRRRTTKVKVAFDAALALKKEDMSVSVTRRLYTVNLGGNTEFVPLKEIFRVFLYTFILLC